MKIELARWELDILIDALKARQAAVEDLSTEPRRIVRRSINDISHLRLRLEMELEGA